MSGGEHSCANCGGALSWSEEVFGLGARLRQGLEYPGGVGRSAAVTIPVGEREVECMVAADASPAKAEGWDLVFMVCCEGCGAALKAALEAGGLFEEIM